MTTHVGDFLRQQHKRDLAEIEDLEERICHHVLEAESLREVQDRRRERIGEIIRTIRMVDGKDAPLLPVETPSVTAASVGSNETGQAPRLVPTTSDAASGEGYISITVTLLERRETVVRVDHEYLPSPVWLVRGWLKKIDNHQLDRVEIGSTVTVCILGERARDTGLALQGTMSQ